MAKTARTEFASTRTTTTAASARTTLFPFPTEQSVYPRTRQNATSPTQTTTFATTRIRAWVQCAATDMAARFGANANRLYKSNPRKCITGFLKGYKRVSHSVCEDMNECELGHPCDSLMCVNTPGSYECLCPAGAKAKRGFFPPNSARKL